MGSRPLLVIVSVINLIIGLLILVYCGFAVYNIITGGGTRDFAILALIAFYILFGLKIMFLELGIKKSWFLRWFGFHETYCGKGFFFIFLACIGVIFSVIKFSFGGDVSVYVSFGFPGFLVVWGIILICLHFCISKKAKYELVRD